MNSSRRIAACTIGVAMFGAATFWAPGAEAATQSLGAVALASDEVTPTAAGDSGATGTVDLRIDGSTGDVCVRAVFTGLSGPLTMAHIHSGAVGANGPVFITLPSTDTAINDCVKATPAEAQAVLAAPGSFYFNAHTAASPGGAVRGQLTASVFNALLTGAAEVPGPGAPNGRARQSSPSIRQVIERVFSLRLQAWSCPLPWLTSIVAPLPLPGLSSFH